MFRFSFLPFGLSSAPRWFTKILKVVVTFFRQSGMRIAIYLDDFLLLNADKGKLAEEVKVVTTTLEALGFLMNFSKSILEPSQRLDYLGVLPDSQAMTFTLPQEKSKISFR